VASSSDDSGSWPFGFRSSIESCLNIFFVIEGKKKMSEVTIQVSDLIGRTVAKDAKKEQFEEFIEHIRSFYEHQQILNDRFISEFDRRKEELDREELEQKAKDGVKQLADHDDEVVVEHGTLLRKE
jgi:hypothetical protein